ncbi:sensor domain-containing phosphodiesterase [Vibrio algivorus]|uniref:Sensor domain-containing phosphodiesterase n=1 Tax=Vibrio algivorus TaxID=1667024 RepID=A0ABQ6ES81_9VIBR|nr:sensor domain-containing phosphodiesterase [Vibrio algivorus]GLT15480.1 sensor domain-containing phosphodiesterase [Vibrio algivorus]
MNQHKETWPSLWQEIVNLVADLTEVPVALIMRKNANSMEVIATNSNEVDNPYQIGDKETLCHNLYCHHVVQTDSPLHVSNALKLDKWKNNPDIKLGMVAYYGLPIHFPDGSTFGTFCILDNKEREFDDKFQRLVQLLASSIESSLAMHIENLKLNDELQERDHYHSLTNLPTQSLCRDKYSHKDNLNLSILFIRNIQAFDIRDNLGLIDAQRLTQEFYKQVKNCIPEDVGIYYISNSEMILVVSSQLPDTLAGKTENLACLLHELFSSPLNLNDKKITIPISIGCAFSYNNAHPFEEVLDMATVACTQGACSGKAFHIFNPDQQKLRQHHYEITQQFPSAFEKNEFYLNYQPIISAETNQIVGCEALVRWNNEKLGMISPDEFIPLAEKCGAMVKLGDWIIDQALESLKRWHKKNPPGFYISINISSTQFSQDDFSDKIKAKLKQYQINPDSILLEITETALLDNQQQVMKHCQELSQLGVKIALDDFGTGFSSLSHLHDFPIDIVKIDKSFIFSLNSSKKSEQLVKGIVSLGKMLDLKVVAEGVESLDICQNLQSLHCDFMQGYYWDRPLSPEDFESIYLDTKSNDKI